MQSKFCCEEMKELVRSIKEAGEKSQTKIFLDDNGNPEELALASDANSFVPNVIFRFCPYCGSLIQKNEAPEVNDSVLNSLVSVVFNKGLDECGASSTYQNEILQDAITKVRAILKNASLTNKPVTGFIKRS